MRFAAFLLGAILLLWIPFEDLNITAVLLYSMAICAWLATRLLIDVPSNPNRLLLRHLVVGTLAGLAVSPGAILLMAIKTGLHGHRVPDFTPDQVQTALRSFPAWAACGLLFGFGSALWRVFREK
jgi:hypothetical protein